MNMAIPMAHGQNCMCYDCEENQRKAEKKNESSLQDGVIGRKPLNNRFDDYNEDAHLTDDWEKESN